MNARTILYLFIAIQGSLWGVASEQTGHAVCYNSSGGMTDCGGPPVLSAGTGLTSGDGLANIGTSGTPPSNFWVQDASASGAASVLFPKGVTLGSGSSCALQYSGTGGGCFSGTNSEVDLLFGSTTTPR